MVTEHEKDNETRFKYAVGSTLLTFGYLAFAANPDTGAAFGFLMIVAGGFGVSKATQHLKLK